MMNGERALAELHEAYRKGQVYIDKGCKIYPQFPAYPSYDFGNIYETFINERNASKNIRQSDNPLARAALKWAQDETIILEQSMWMICQVQGLYTCIVIEPKANGELSYIWFTQNRDQNSVWYQLPFQIHTNDYGSGDSIFEIIDLSGSIAITEELREYCEATHFAVISQISYLLNRNYAVVENDSGPSIIDSINEGRSRSKDRLSPLPRPIIIDPMAPMRARNDCGGSHASPVPHNRRSHIRMRNGKAIMVRAAKINGGSDVVRHHIVR